MALLTKKTRTDRTLKIIILGNLKGHSRRLDLSRAQQLAVAAGSLSLLIVFAVAGYWTARYQAGALPAEHIAQWQQSTERLEAEVKQLKQTAEQERRAYALRLARFQSRLLRLDAVGEQVASMAGLEDGEFNFSETPAVGGPAPSRVGEYTDSVVDFGTMLRSVEQKLDDREGQLEILEDLIANRQLRAQSVIAGRPVNKGWMSSSYGSRTDPFSGGRDWHRGVDFAGKLGADIVAVAAGVVTWSGERAGYGTMIEISHGEGYVTRYGHNQANLVEVGDVVKRGDVIATMGSSGRSTGPHVHFEVLRGGKPVNPSRYVYRKRA